jgi:hypothetical protein
LKGQDAGDEKTDDQTENRDQRRPDGDGAERAAKPHGRQRGKHNQTGNHDRAHHFHAQHDGHGGEHSDHRLIGAGGQPTGARERFVKGDGENLPVKQQKQRQHAQGKHDGQNQILVCQCDDGGGAEQAVAYVRVAGTGKIENQAAHRNCARGQQRYGRVAMQTAVFAQPQNDKRRCDDDGNGDFKRIIGHTQHGGDRHRAKAHMGQAVADHRKAPQHQADAQKRRAKRDQYANAQRAPDDLGQIRIVKHLRKGHSGVAPFRSKSARYCAAVPNQPL